LSFKRSKRAVDFEVSSIVRDRVKPLGAGGWFARCGSVPGTTRAGEALTGVAVSGLSCADMSGFGTAGVGMTNSEVGGAGITDADRKGAGLAGAEAAEAGLTGITGICLAGGGMNAAGMAAAG
jgi:hypothetical protein